MYYVLEAIVVEQLPRSLQRRYSRLCRRVAPSVPAYQYWPLDEGEIRLLVVKRSAWMRPSLIEASLIHVSLNEYMGDEPCVQYEAISYRWGDAKKVDFMLIDGADFQLTRSAFNVLMARRSLHKERTLWIDAVCINQSHQNEKSRQIQMMQDICRCAYRVIVVPDVGWQMRLAANTLLEMETALALPWGDALEFGLVYSARRSGLSALLLNEYFSRSWILQEVALGYEVELYLGGIYFPWNQYFQSVKLLLAPERQYLLASDPQRSGLAIGRPNVTTITMMRYGLVEFAEEITLELILLTTAAHFNATDARDKVFSILGLTTDDTQSALLRPDYTKSPEKVFKDLAVYLFSRPKPSIHLLALAGVGFPQSRRALPSWVPDLSLKKRVDSLTLHPVVAEGFQASGEMRPNFILTGDDNCALKIGGILCDEIIDFSDAGPWQRFPVMKGWNEQKKLFISRDTFLKAAEQAIHRNARLWNGGSHGPLKSL